MEEGRGFGARLRPEDQERFRAQLLRMSRHQGPIERFGRVALRAWLRFVAWRVDVHASEPLPTTPGRRPGAGCIVAVAPHRAWVEPFLLLHAWPPDAARLVWLADGRTVTRSWRRWLLPRVGVIPVGREYGGPRAYAELATEVLGAGAALAVFPEIGPPSSPEHTRRISPGFAYMALGAGAPVVPVVMGGTHHIVRGARFSVDRLATIDSGDRIDDPFTPAARGHAHQLVQRYERAVAEVLPGRTAEADSRRPRRERWRWLATLFE